MLGSDNDSYLSVGPGLLLPLLQSTITGSLAALIVFAGLRLASWDVDPGGWALAVGAVVSGITWLGSLAAWRGRVYGAQLPHGAVETQPMAEYASSVRVELHETDNKTIRFIDLPGDPEAIRALARGLLGGMSAAESVWTGSGQPFTRGEFSRLRDEMIRRRLLAWNSPGTPARGCQLSLAGKHVMAKLAEAQSDN